jgi:carbon-monoxide dehydrogenase medium subunit
MYPARFDYFRPTTLEAAIQILADRPHDTKVLAGGASLVPLMKLRLAEPARLVDIGAIAGLDGVSVSDGSIVIGALLREADLAASAAGRRLPILADAARVIADPLVRNVGTVGGNVAHGDPANDHPAVMLALDATFLVRGPRGEREIAAASFHTGLLATALEADEILTAIRVHEPTVATGSAYVKFERQVGDYAIAAAAAVVTLDGGVIQHARVAFTNLAATAVRSPSIERALAGAPATVASVVAATDAFVDEEIDPWDDLRGTAIVKRRMARVAARRAIERALTRASRAGT